VTLRDPSDTWTRHKALTPNPPQGISIEVVRHPNGDVAIALVGTGGIARGMRIVLGREDAESLAEFMR
jgi:hypothetical protein